MATIDVLDATGKKTGTRELPGTMFEAPVNVSLMHQVVVAGLAGIRAGTHSTKTRGEVSGGLAHHLDRVPEVLKLSPTARSQLRG